MSTGSRRGRARGLKRRNLMPVGRVECPYGKVAYPTRDQAKLARKRRGDRTLNVYRCELCGYFHGGCYAGQIGAEATPAEFIDALLKVTAECKRVLKPTGSLFVNLGDTYSRGATNHLTGRSSAGRPARSGDRPATTRRPKSLMGLPWRYALACVDDLELILRAEVVWGKPNGLPESVTDRVRRSHEQWFHFTKAGRYYAAVDELREPHADHTSRYYGPGTDADPRPANVASNEVNPTSRRLTSVHPLGKLPGSVWEVATEPLRVPAGFYSYDGAHWRASGSGVAWSSDGAAVQRRFMWERAAASLAAGRPFYVSQVDHFAAFPSEWPRRLILGWSPPGICAECGEGRRPVVSIDQDPQGRTTNGPKNGRRRPEGAASFASERRTVRITTITGYACACDTPDAPTRPAVVLDPFCGTGTVPMVARALGRDAIGVDLSADYLRLARWRVFESGHARKAVERTNRERQGALL